METNKKDILGGEIVEYDDIDVPDLTKSQVDRLHNFDFVQDELCKFLEKTLKQFDTTNDLRTTIENKMQQKVVDDDNEISFTALTRALEVLKNDETKQQGNILELFKNYQKIVVETRLKSDQGALDHPSNKDSQLTKDDMKDLKKIKEMKEEFGQFIEVFDSIKKGEFTKDE